MELAGLLSIIIFIITYGLIISTKVHRTVAALTGALGMVLIGSIFGFMSPELAMQAIDLNIFFLLLGMMMITSIVQEAGFFEIITRKLIQISKGNLKILMVLIVLITALTSAFIDDVTTVLMMVPIIIEISKKLKKSPLPLIIATALGADFGGTNTLIGDPPNILIGSAAELSFLDFICEITPFSIIALVFGILFIYLRLGRYLGGKFKIEIEAYEVKNKKLLIESSSILLITIILFFFHGKLGLPTSFVAMLGATLLLLLSLKDPRRILEKVEWPTLIFISSLFVLVEGLNRAGVIEVLVAGTLNLCKNNLLAIFLLLLWLSAICASLMDSVPYTAMMIPAIIKISESLQISGFSPLWIAIAIGTGFGACSTPVGRIATVTAIGISEAHGYPVSFSSYVKTVLPITVSILAIISLIFIIIL
jgi:Na+/H+ antiporter NhaD/arsenite permease-like protein